MFIAKVTGTVWATAKHPTLEGFKLLLVTPYDPATGETSGKEQLAVEAQGIGAGIGTVVTVIDEGGSARTVMGINDAPVRTIIVGIVDEVTARGESYKP